MKYKCINKIKDMVLGLIFVSLIFPTTLSLNNREMATKLEIETNLEEKVVNIISKIYDVNKFAVTTNVLLISPTNSGSNTNTQQSFGSLQLEGILPAVPQKSESNTLVNSNDYRVQIKDITIWLDYDLDIIDARNNIRPFLFKTMDWLSDCENCIQFQRTQFTKNGNSNMISSSTSSIPISNGVDSEDISIIEDNITYLMDQLDKLNDSMNSDGYGNEKHQWMIDYLERNLQEEKDASSDLSNKLMSLQDRIISRDSSIIMNTTLGQKEIAQTAMKENTRIVEKNIDNQFENNRYMLIVLFILIGVVILLVILSFFNKGPKTVYLKPKGQKSDTNQASINDVNKIESNETANKSNAIVNTASEAINTTPTSAYADDSVIQSDLKNIKQSAVKMSVGQKHGASQIVKDWLDDGGESNEDNVENKQDETEE
ncbi:MAG: hypothetical protein CBB66_02135 [bacterium TMED6]|nr:MAG: hypothetical protein CBB66_02135 [bacterium TMED6]